MGGFAASKRKLRDFDNHPATNAPPLLGKATFAKVAETLL
jgi:hypothetical protein